MRIEVNDENLLKQDKQDRNSLATSVGYRKKIFKIQMTQEKVMENWILSLIFNCSKTASVIWILLLSWTVKEGGNF